jgi:hypothetical protein
MMPRHQVRKTTALDERGISVKCLFSKGIRAIPGCTLSFSRKKASVRAKCGRRDSRSQPAMVGGVRHHAMPMDACGAMNFACEMVLWTWPWQSRF